MTAMRTHTRRLGTSREGVGTLLALPGCVSRSLLNFLDNDIEICPARGGAVRTPARWWFQWRNRRLMLPILGPAPTDPRYKSQMPRYYATHPEWSAVAEV